MNEALLNLLSQEEPAKIILNQLATLRREDILAVYEAGPEVVVKFIKRLIGAIVEFQERVKALRARIKALEDQLNQNSRNSNKPPSTDRFVRPRSPRKISDRLVGGQEGHPGHTLKMVNNPDHIVTHRVSRCDKCGSSLEEIQANCYERRQVFDLPPIKVEATEHRGEEKLCPNCGYLNKAAFPKEVKQPVQYGARLKATAVYLSQYQLLPYERTSELFADLFGHQLSQATLVKANEDCYESLKSVEEEIKEQIIASPVAHFDETPLYRQDESFF